MSVLNGNPVVSVEGLMFSDAFMWRSFLPVALQSFEHCKK